jgi:hypothetical protein
MNEQELEVQADPSAKRVIEGLRDTGYDFNTAISDIIDNSITANAKNIDITVNLKPGTTEPYVYIADDGFGMNHSELITAMKYGSTATKSNDKLGKFGLGLKTASTAFCRDLSVVSRSKGNPAVKAEWDLDYIAEKNLWLLKMPAPSEDELEILDATAKGNPGTLVEWGKVDRLVKNYVNISAAQKALNTLIEELRFHLSMTFQNFLDESKKEYPTISIKLNGQKILPWDPFCTNMPGVEALVGLHNGRLQIQMPDQSISYIRFEGYVLPRQDEMSPENKKKAQISNDLQGIYIYREGRLIHYGNYLGMLTNEPHGSLLRIKLAFQKDLDELFNVDIKKSRILLNTQVYDEIQKDITPWRREAESRYRYGQAKDQSKQASSAHEDAGRVIESNAQSVDTTPIVVKDAKTGQVEIKNERGTFDKKIVIENDENKTGRVIPVPSINDGMLWQPSISEGKQAVEINEGHPFYAKVYGPILKNSPVVQGIDYLFWALANAENAIYDPNAQRLYEDFRYQVSHNLRKLVESLPDPEPSADNDDKK